MKKERRHPPSQVWKQKREALRLNLKDRYAVGDILGSAQGAEVGRANELDVLGKEANMFFVAKEGIPPVEVGVELDS